MALWNRTQKKQLAVAQEQADSLEAIRSVFEGAPETTSINETQKQGLDILAPDEAQKPSRRPYIALLSGSPKDYVDIIAAAVELAGWDALSKGKEIPNIPDNIVDMLTELSASIDGHRAREIVEVARSTAPTTAPTKKRGFWGRGG